MYKYWILPTPVFPLITNNSSCYHYMYNVYILICSSEVEVDINCLFDKRILLQIEMNIKAITRQQKGDKNRTKLLNSQTSTKCKKE